MDWWSGFSGWAITTGLALIAASVPIAQEVRYRRTRPVMLPFIRPAGFATKEEDGVVVGRWDRFILTNQGTADMRIRSLVVAGAKPEYPHGDNFRVPAVVTAGAEAQFVVVEGGGSTGWVLLLAHHPRGHAYFVQMWVPLDSDGPMGDTWFRELEAERSIRGRVRRLLRPYARHVGPGGAPRVEGSVRQLGRLPMPPDVPTVYPLV